MDADYRSYVLSAIAQDYGKLSDSQSAQRVLEKATSAAETNDDVCSSDALIEIARVYDQISDLQSALAILEKATTAAETIDHAYSRIYALGKIAQAYGQLSDLQSAQGVLEKATIAAEAIDRASDRNDALNEIVNAAVNLSLFQSPQAVLERATTAAETIEDAYSRSYKLKEIAQAYGQLSKLKAAQAVLEKATIAAETIKDVYSRSDALSAILTVSQCLGPYQTLLDNLPDTPSEQMVFLDNALSDVDGNHQRSNTSRHEILLQIIQALRQCPHAARPKDLLNRILAVAHSLTLPELRDKVLAAIAVAYCRIPHWEDAFQTLEPCADDIKADTMIQILTLWIKHQNPASRASASQHFTTEPIGS